ncbi:hypothetical protein NITHO_80004 [Nitrolancea hollandica Lb]|uniref:Uncharacterized protein n=1 Tax=Nitrolancea hollandica Lb TaxID=1129897 RepID=I4EN91_9BACT|nr:hypothetical protein NITHO_80004 [Nitrolancea hollandica Lb]
MSVGEHYASCLVAGPWMGADGMPRPFGRVSEMEMNGHLSKVCFRDWMEDGGTADPPVAKAGRLQDAGDPVMSIDTCSFSS